MKRKFGLTLLATGALFFALLPSAAFARDHDEDGHGYSRGQSVYRGGGHSEGANRFGRGFSEGRGGYNRGRDFDDHERYEHGRGDRDHDRDRYRGGGLYFGYGAPYVYGPNYYYPGACNPAGYYDQWGNWVPYPGCYVNPY